MLHRHSKSGSTDHGKQSIRFASDELQLTNEPVIHKKNKIANTVPTKISKICRSVAPE